MTTLLLIHRLPTHPGEMLLQECTALRLERLFGMDAGFWLTLQLHWDLWQAKRAGERR